MNAEVRVIDSVETRQPPRVWPVWSLLALVGAGAWVYTVTRARAMGVGPGTMDMAVVFFTTMWLAMMAAMMLPAIGRLAAEEGATITGRSTTASLIGPALAFGAGFLVPWAAYGGLAYVAFAATGHLVSSSPSAVRWLGVGIFAVAGLYQFTPVKRRALVHCRMPMGAPAAAGPLAGGFVGGLRDGAICVGCCAAFMAIFLATGVMSVSTMVGLAAVILGEKLLPENQARVLTVVVGVALLGLAVAAVVHPAVLGGLHPAGGPMPMEGTGGSSMIGQM
jgi:predicted metal-binding membrane protein